MVHRGKVLILAYHRVLPDGEENKHLLQPGMYVTRSVFAKQIEFLRTHYEIISLGDLLERWRKRSLEKQKRYCVLTFDDGWLDNYLYAYPVLRKYAIPATIFLPTSYIGTRQWFWTDKLTYLLADYKKAKVSRSASRALSELLRGEEILNDLLFTTEFPADRTARLDRIDAIIERLKRISSDKIQECLTLLSEILYKPFPEERLFLNWTEIAEMSRHNIAFGSHSCSHKILTMLSPDEIQQELVESMRVLQTRNIHFLPVLSYPNGNTNPQVERLTRIAGYKAAFSMRFGVEKPLPANLFAIRRIGVHQDISKTMPLFTFYLLGLQRLWIS